VDESAADALLNDEVDEAMQKFSTKNPPFFNEDSSARVIIDRGERHQKAPTPAAPTPPTR
jgi:hypothetical protein